MSVQSGDCKGDSNFCAAAISSPPRPQSAGHGGVTAPAARGRLSDLALGGKFWAAVDLLPELDVSDGESRSSEGEGGSEVTDSGELLAGGPPARATLGGFIDRAEELGGSLRMRRRTAFAPGGRGSRFQGGSSPRFVRLGDGLQARGQGRRWGASRRLFSSSVADGLGPVAARRRRRRRPLSRLPRLP
jgi:hypothetical protein